MPDLRNALESDQTLLGGWLSIPAPFSAELMARSGFDWLCVDTQHGLIGYQTMTAMLQAIAITGCPAVVRVPWNEPSGIMRALDAGAQGVVVPVVNTPDDARRAVSACRYPPDGIRSWGPVRAALGAASYTAASANRTTTCIVQIETGQAVSHLDEILTVPGIDVAYVGPADLAVSLGHAPTFRAADMPNLPVIHEIRDKCLRAGVVPGIHCTDPQSVEYWREQGFRFITAGSDRGFMTRAASEDLATLRR